MRTLANVVFVGLIAFVFTACGDDATSETTTAQDVVIKVQVLDWTYGAQAVEAWGLPEIQGTVSEGGELSVTLPGALPESAVKDVLPPSTEANFSDYVWCGTDHLGCHCLDGITVSPASAKGAIFEVLWWEMEDPDAREGNPDSTIKKSLVTENSNRRLFRVYAAADTQVTGSCTYEGTNNKTTSFNLDLKAGWNTVESKADSSCLEGDEIDCLKYHDSWSVESTTVTSIDNWIVLSD